MKKSSRQQGNIFSNPNFYHYVVEYQGNIQEEILKQPGYYVTIINDKYAIVSSDKDIQLNLQGPLFSTILYVAQMDIFTLQQVSPVEASGVNFLQLQLPLNLTGTGVDVAIIDTGIDYLSDEFIRENGETRIEYIWDQTIESNGVDKNSIVPYGTVYDKNKIQEAINAFRNGKSPYEIVPSKDEIGHGTNMAGIIGARGKNPSLKGIAPDCNFVIVKLRDYVTMRRIFGFTIPVYDLFSIFPALDFLYKYSLNTNKPLIIYFPLGSNLGNHKGDSILEQYINSISRRSGLAVVTSTGNQGGGGFHSSGIVPQVNESRSIQLYISPEQKNIIVEIWIEVPNIMSLEVISPSGESTGIIGALIKTVDTYSFVFESTQIVVNSYFPEELSGEQSYTIRLFNVRQGMWKFRLNGLSILSGKFNAWIPGVGLSVGGTGFIPSDPYGTIIIPSTSDYTITAAAYNQNNNNILEYSGMAFLNDYINKIDAAAGGVDALTVAPNNTTAIANGTSVSGAVMAGTCALLFQWGIVQGNDPNIYSQTLKTYIQRGAVPRTGDIYPNPQLGYGILNIPEIFRNIS